MKLINKKAFTLIELLAVILILGIIALIAIPTVNNIINESKKGAFKASVIETQTCYLLVGKFYLNKKVLEAMFKLLKGMHYYLISRK